MNVLHEIFTLKTAMILDGKSIGVTRKRYHCVTIFNKNLRPILINSQKASKKIFQQIFIM